MEGHMALPIVPQAIPRVPLVKIKYMGVHTQDEGLTSQ